MITTKAIMITTSIIAILVVIKVLWVEYATSGHGDFETEKKEIIYRVNYLTSKVATSPQRLLDEMPNVIGRSFKASGLCILVP